MDISLLCNMNKSYVPKFGPPFIYASASLICQIIVQCTSLYLKLQIFPFLSLGEYLNLYNTHTKQCSDKQKP